MADPLALEAGLAEGGALLLVGVLPSTAFAQPLSGAAASLRVGVLPAAGVGVRVSSHLAGGLAALLAHLV